MQQAKYTQRSPCPVCGRYRTAYKNKCYGFITDRGIIYCSREESEGKTAEVFSKKVYSHSLSLPSVSETKNRDRGLSPSTLNTIAETPPREIKVEVRRYSKNGHYREESTKTWYVVYEGGKEITRDLLLERVLPYAQLEEC